MHPMPELLRTVRFCLRGDGSLDVDAAKANAFAAWPPMRGLGRYYELDVACRGEIDPQTGYMVNIKDIDEAVRAAALPRVSDLARSADDEAIGTLLAGLFAPLNERLPWPVSRLALRVAPTVVYTMEDHDMAGVQLSQRFDFSAAHRLHVEELDEAENRQIFGKCNNPSGHGHNYQLEVVVRAPIDEAGRVMPVGKLDAIVKHHVLDAYDHMHLNCDVPDFADLNPSTENIARQAYARLQGPVAETGAELVSVQVWETDRTACVYRGEAAETRRT